MPSGSYRQADVGCPFYKYDDSKKRITCEGLIGMENSSLELIYRRKSDFDRQMDNFCCKNYQQCKVYRILMEKYEEENL